MVYSRVCLVLSKTLIVSHAPKMRLGRGREYFVASSPRALRLLAFREYDFSEVEKAMIQGVAWHYLGTLYILPHPKCDLVNV